MSVPLIFFQNNDLNDTGSCEDGPQAEGRAARKSSCVHICPVCLLCFLCRMSRIGPIGSVLRTTPPFLHRPHLVHSWFARARTNWSLKLKTMFFLFFLFLWYPCRCHWYISPRDSAISISLQLAKQIPELIHHVQACKYLLSFAFSSAFSGDFGFADFSDFVVLDPRCFGDHRLCLCAIHRLPLRLRRSLQVLRIPVRLWIIRLPVLRWIPLQMKGWLKLWVMTDDDMDQHFWIRTGFLTWINDRCSLPTLARQRLAGLGCSKFSAQ